MQNILMLVPNFNWNSFQVKICEVSNKQWQASFAIKWSATNKGNAYSEHLTRVLKVSKCSRGKGQTKRTTRKCCRSKSLIWKKEMTVKNH